MKIAEFFLSMRKKFTLDSYEGEPGLFSSANGFWKQQNMPNIKIIEEYFSDHEDIVNLLIPNLPDWIEDYKETKERFTEKYMKVYRDGANNYVQKVNFIPDIVFIDASRFMHINVINTCYKFYKENPNCIYIMEEDYFVNGNYGETGIIERHFVLKDLTKYRKGTHDWPFVTFKIESKKATPDTINDTKETSEEVQVSS